MSEIYDKMKAKGIDMSWYDKNRHTVTSGSVPLDDEECFSGSIYHLAMDGSLWTINKHGEPHKKVREGIKAQKKTVYVCARCKLQWDDVLGSDGMVTHALIPLL